MSIFNINFIKLRERLIPSFLKDVNFIKWLDSNSKPIETLYSFFVQFRTNTNLLLSYNSRTKIFEEYLNDTFDTTSRRIYIVNNSKILKQIFIYFKSEENAPTYIFNKSEGGSPSYIRNYIEFNLDFDFTVFVPNGLSFDINKMNSTIKSVKLAGKRYEIKLF